MRRKFWQTQKFKELLELWEEKLRASGFKDAETKGNLRPNPYDSCRVDNQVQVDGKLRYFELLGQAHHAEKYEDEVASYVMEKRSNGVSTKQIGIELKLLGKRNSTETIRKIIRHYEGLWGLKKKR